MAGRDRLPGFSVQPDSGPCLPLPLDIMWDPMMDTGVAGVTQTGPPLQEGKGPHVENPSLSAQSGGPERSQPGSVRLDDPPEPRRREVS